MKKLKIMCIKLSSKQVVNGSISKVNFLSFAKQILTIKQMDVKKIAKDKSEIKIEKVQDRAPTLAHESTIAIYILSITLLLINFNFFINIKILYFKNNLITF